jgi:hypothetical protein
MRCGDVILQVGSEMIHHQSHEQDGGLILVAAGKNQFDIGRGMKPAPHDFQLAGMPADRRLGQLQLPVHSTAWNEG